MRTLNPQNRIQDLEQQLEHQKKRIREMNHRLKNNLQIAAGLLKRVRRNNESTPVGEDLQTVTHQLHSMAELHDTLSQTPRGVKVSLTPYLERVVEEIQTSLGSEDCLLKTDFNQLEATLSTRKATGSGLVIVELIMNGYQHGIDDQSNTTIEVWGHSENGYVLLTVRNKGRIDSPVRNEESSEQQGFDLVQSLVEEDLEGTVDVQNGDGSVAIVLRFPATEPPLPSTQAEISSEFIHPNSELEPNEDLQDLLVTLCLNSCNQDCLRLMKKSLVNQLDEKSVPESLKPDFERLLGRINDLGKETTDRTNSSLNNSTPRDSELKSVLSDFVQLYSDAKRHQTPRVDKDRFFERIESQLEHASSG